MDEPAINLSGCTLAVLAGGAGTRMGKPKGLLQVRGRPILRYLLDRFQWLGPTMVVTSPGRERPPGFEAFDKEVVDAVADEGPLRGVLTALEACETETVVVTTVDMPGVGREQLEWLVARLMAHRFQAAVMLRRGEQIEPFPLALAKSWDRIVREHVRSGARSVHSIGREGEAELIDAPGTWPDEVWVNLNRPQDLAAWASSLGTK